MPFGVEGIGGGFGVVVSLSDGFDLSRMGVTGTEEVGNSFSLILVGSKVGLSEL